ncbi:MAG: chromosomal replication initiator protein DnaA [Candidatus Omnitrophica bacterium]|nr:chromosomal replication initiator protein DnaA [Candidatus Omnitrophota bacterium]
MNLADIWGKAQEGIKNRIGQTSYDTWFAALQVTEKDASTLVIQTPDDFFKNWIIDHYQASIQEELLHFSPAPIHVEFSVNADLITSQQNTIPDTAPSLPIKDDKQYRVPLNSRFTFDNFVIGASNRFACAAGLAVAESPAKAYNPLLIYGQVGLGKTHLIQAITHKIRKLHPDLKICYLSSESFTNELIDAIRNRSTLQFRKKYRDIDVLLIDDIHFIAGKESTQEEFFHTFNALHDSRKQIILTSDRPPKEIANLEERLRSRFAWGLITDIQPPDYETRVAILKKKIEYEPVNVPHEVIHFIAEQIKTNIRELEGALIRVAAYSLLEDRPIDLEIAKTILKDMVENVTKTISVEMIQKEVAQHFKLKVEDLRSKKRLKTIVHPRQIAMYLSRQLTNMSLPEIGGAFGGKDHTTVLHSCKKIEEEIKENTQLINLIDQLTTELTR